MKESNVPVASSHAKRMVLVAALAFLALVLAACQVGAGSSSSNSSDIGSTVQGGGSDPTPLPNNTSTSSSVKTEKEPDSLDDAAKQKYADQLADFEARREKIRQDYENDPRAAGSMAEMRQMSADEAQELEALMNDICDYVGKLPGVSADTVATEQEAWKKDWQEEADKMTAEFKESPYSGNSYGLELNAKYADAINKRIDELLNKAYAAIGVDHAKQPTQPKQTESKTSQDVSGYVVRFNTADGTFACDGIDIPQSAAAFREKYGDDSARSGGPAWVTSIPKTDLKVSYAEGAPNSEIISIEGPLGQIVSGVPEGEAIPLKDFVGALSSYNGTFDLSKSMSRSGSAATPYGKCYLVGSSQAIEDEGYSGTVCIAFADRDVKTDEYFDQQCRALYIDVADGSVTGRSHAILSVGVQ